MTWLTERQLELFRKVFDEVDFIPLNRRANLKLRGLSFFSTDAKSVKQLTKYIIDISDGKELEQPQYYNAVKNSCLVNQDNTLNKFGKLFLKFLRLNDGEALNAIINSSSIRSIDDKYLLPLEYIILSAVYDNWNCNDRPFDSFACVSAARAAHLLERVVSVSLPGLLVHLYVAATTAECALGVCDTLLLLFLL